MQKVYPKPAAVDNFTLAREQFLGVEHWLQSTSSLQLEHFDLEDQLDKKGRELLRMLLQSHLDLRAEREVRQVSVLGSDGMTRTHVVKSERGLTSIFGVVDVERLRYGKPGNSSLFPADKELNLPTELYSHGLRFRAAEQASRGSYDQTVEALERYLGLNIGKRQVEELTQRTSVDFDAFYALRTVPDTEKTSDLLIMTTDGKGIVMRSEDLRPSTRKAAEQSAKKLRTRLSKGEKKDRKRMAVVAAVYSVAPHVRTPEQILRSLAPVHDVQPKRPKPTNKRVWASVVQDPVKVIDDMFEEAQRRDLRHKRTWVALVDGNAHQLELLRSIARERGIELHIVIDFIHVLEYLWKAAWCFFDEGAAEAEQWVAERALRLLKGNASTVAAGIRRSATLRAIDKNERKQIDKTCHYILKYANLMQYDKALENGWPIATGVIEGACRHLVKDRMDITGARWSLHGAEAVLKMRAIRVSGDLDEYWRFHLQRERRRNYGSGFTNLRVVESQPSI